MSDPIMQYAYTGDVKRLIPMGYTFQKLFAGNHRAYHNDDLFMYVICKMVLEITNVEHKNQAALVGFIIDNIDQPDTFWEKDRYIEQINVTFTDTHHLTQDGVVLTEEEYRSYRSEAFDQLARAGSTEEEKAAGIKRYAAHPASRDPFPIRLPLVNKIKALHAETPLTLVDWNAK